MAESVADAWPAPAKLNLMLRVLGRRDDGYHRLQTVFQFLGRCDYLRFRSRRDGRIRRITDLSGVPEASDLAIRAARLLQEYTGCPLGADISVDKHLPMGGGLGGGSSDAATALVALNRIWDTELSVDRLAALGLSLGADVPVFVRGFAAWGEGIGEELTPVDLAQPWYLVLTPPCEVSTAAVFSAPDLTRNSPSITISDFVSGDDRNDCLAIVRRRYTLVADALDWLSAHASARLTGTGACVFAAFADRAQALRVLSDAPSVFNGFVAPGMNRSPLLDRLFVS